MNKRIQALTQTLHHTTTPVSNAIIPACWQALRQTVVLWHVWWLTIVTEPKHSSYLSDLVLLTLW